MSASNAWNIRPRSNRCCVTDREFENDEMFYTAIFFNKEINSYERSDFSANAWEQHLNQKNSNLFHSGGPNLKKKPICKRSSRKGKRGSYASKTD